jgi:hypothetical protein
MQHADPARRLRHVVGTLLAGQELPPDDQVWLGTALSDFLDGEALEQALGLADGTTGPSQLRRARWAERDLLLRELAATYDGAVMARVTMLAHDLRSYVATGWPHDRRRGEPCPPSRRRILMYRVCMADPGRKPPLGISRLHGIIRAESDS